MFKKRNTSPPPPPPIIIPHSHTLPPPAPETIVLDVSPAPAPAPESSIVEVHQHPTSDRINESIYDNPHYKIIIHKLKMDISLYIQKINYDIGYYWWKAYIYSAFWNHISTPINLIIMILTALTTGHSVTDSIISNNNSTTLGLATLILSIFNTFFRPGQQMNICKENMAKWYKMGIDFEKIYYSKFQNFNAAELSKKIDELQKIFNDVNELKRTQETNFIIDIIFLLSKRYLIRRNLTWIPKHGGKNRNKDNDVEPSPPQPDIEISIPQLTPGDHASNDSHDSHDSHESHDSSINIPPGIIELQSTKMLSRTAGISVQCRDIIV